MKREHYFCDLCEREIAVPPVAKFQQNNELKIKIKPSGKDGWEHEDAQPFLDLCGDCEKEILDVLMKRYNIGHG
jgi:hypothetical protein